MKIFIIKTDYVKPESAKLRALRVHVPTLFACLRAHVLTSSRANMFCVFTYGFCAFRAYVLMHYKYK